MKIDALWVVEPGKIEIHPLDLPAPSYNEIQVKTEAVGICTWDSYLFQGQDAPGPLPYRIGHEGVGVVIAKGEAVKGLELGDKIFVGSGGDEMMASHFNVEADCVAKIPAEEEDFIKWVAEPSVCVVNILRETDVQPGDEVVLIGAGYMGLLTLQGLIKTSPAGRVRVFDIDEDRLELARKYTPYCYNSSKEEGIREIDRIVALGGAQVVIELAGNQQTLDLATRLSALEGGKLIIASWHRGERRVDSSAWHTRGLKVLNVAPKTNPRFKDLTRGTGRLIERGVYDTRSLVTHTANFYKLEEVYDIFKKSINKSDGYIKGVITFD